MNYTIRVHAVPLPTADLVLMLTYWCGLDQLSVHQPSSKKVPDVLRATYTATCVFVNLDLSYDNCDLITCDNDPANDSVDVTVWRWPGLDRSFHATGGVSAFTKWYRCKWYRCSLPYTCITLSGFTAWDYWRNLTKGTGLSVSSADIAVDQ